MKSQPTSAINKISDLNSVTIYVLSNVYLGSSKDQQENANDRSIA